MSAHRSGIVAAVAILALAGCSTSTGTTGLTAGSPSTTPITPVVQATTHDSGHTVTLTRGQRLLVKLDSTYWTFAPTAAQLRAVGEPTVSRSQPCVPGGGCGTVTATFDAVAPGQLTVAADRTSCGEAMRCVGSSGTYRLTVVVH